jgi:hypothetical protein
MRASSGKGQIYPAVGTSIPLYEKAGRWAGRSVLEHHVAQLRVELQRVHPTLTPIPDCFEAAERGPQIPQEPAVDPTQPDVDLSRQPG